MAIENEIQTRKEVNHMLLTPFDMASYSHLRESVDWSGRIERPKKRWLVGHRYTRTPNT